MGDADPRDTCSGCFGYGPCVDPARHGRRIGPIERELRKFMWNETAMIFGSTTAAYMCWWDAWISLGRPGAHPQHEKFFADIASEAIEAAEALGL